MLTAVYLINRLPSSILENKTPYEVLFGQVPSFSHLKVFGCLCYASTLAHHRHKFSPRAVKCVFLGYPLRIKGYKVMDLATHSVFISRDVHFHDIIFPFQSDLSSQHIDPFHSISPLAMPIPASDGLSVFPTPIDSIPSSNEPSPSQPILIDTSVTDIVSVHPSTPTAPLDSIPTPTFLDSQIPNISSVQLRKSTRPHKLPSYLQDYSCNSISHKPSSGSPYDIVDHLSYANIGLSHQSFSLAINAEVEPKFFHQAMKSKA